MTPRLERGSSGFKSQFSHFYKNVMTMNICEKYFIPDELSEKEAIEWAKQQAVLEFESGEWEFIYEGELIDILSYLYGDTNSENYVELFQLDK